MTFSRTIHNAWDRNQLLTALIELTYACNLRCVFCYNDLALQGSPLTLQHYFQLLDDLLELNALNVTLSGGEPLAHPHFFAIGARAKELGFVVRIKSNGHAIKPAMAQRIREQIDPYVIEVSLHGACASTHDRQTQVPGSFERLTSNIESMKNIGLRVKVNSVLTKWNENEISAMYTLCESLGVPLQIDTDVKPRDDGDRSPLELLPTQQGRDSYLAVAARQLRPGSDNDDEPAPAPERKKHCGAGSSTVAIDPYGNVLPCVQWRQPIGNLHDTRLSSLWTSGSLHAIRKTTEEARGFIAQHGGDSVLGNFCPGIAHTHSGNPLTLYPAMEVRINKPSATHRKLPILHETSL